MRHDTAQSHALAHNDHDDQVTIRRPDYDDTRRAVCDDDNTNVRRYDAGRKKTIHDRDNTRRNATKTVCATTASLMPTMTAPCQAEVDEPTMAGDHA